MVLGSVDSQTDEMAGRFGAKIIIISHQVRTVQLHPWEPTQNASAHPQCVMINKLI